MLSFFDHPESRRILIMLGAAGIAAIVGAGIYVAAMRAVTPTPLPAGATQGGNGVSS